MSKFYGKMQKTASKLLKKFDQGGISLDVYTEGLTDEPWNPVDPTYTKNPIDGTALGVSTHHLQDTLIKSTDLIVTIPADEFTPKMQDRVTVGGRQHAIKKIMAKPATGIIAAYQIFIGS